MNIPRHWQPLVELPRSDFAPYSAEVIAETMKHYGVTDAEARAMMKQYDDRCRFFVNDLYQVQVMSTGHEDKCLHLNIRRRDGGIFKDWRHFQEIKNQLAGPEREAVELYPAESRKVDTSNKWHLWVLPEGEQTGFGWQIRDVDYTERRHLPGIRQRPL